MKHRIVKLAFAELSPHDRVEVLMVCSRSCPPIKMRVAVNDPECLGLVAEARLIGLQRSDQLARYLPGSDVRRLGALVSEALVGRLPRP
jgi:hypothetical protein